MRRKYTSTFIPTSSGPGEATSTTTAAASISVKPFVISSEDGEFLSAICAADSFCLFLGTDHRDNVLRVPSQAIRYVPTGSASTASNNIGILGGVRIFVLRGGQPIPLAVETGLDDDNYVEITKGDLKAGDEVISGEQVATGLAGAPNQRAAPRAPRL
jgi:hypothetical protein